jgi:putative ABC transport system permease protein
MAARLYAFCLPGRAERELTREVDAHVGLLEEEYRRRGMTNDDASVAARRDMHGVESLKEQQRDARSFPRLEDAQRDVRHALRTLARTPGFTAAASLTIALGIGSVVTVFSVVQSVVLRPLPYDRPDQLVRLVETVSAAASPTGVPLRRVSDSLSVGELDELRHRAETVSHMASYINAFMTLTDTGETARLEGWRVEPAFLTMLGVHPLYGRVFEPADALPGAANVIVLGYGVWQRHLGGRPEAIGTRLTLDNKRYTIVGVMPREFEFPVEFSSHDFWAPLALDLTSNEARGLRLPTVARLANGASLEMAATEVGFILRAMNGKTSAYEFVPVQAEWVAPIRRALRSFGVGVWLVLLIAAVNISGLLLARTATRQREIAIRAALGGSRARIVRFLLTESVLLALLGSIVGVLLAFISVRLLQTFATTMSRMDLGKFTAFPRLGEIGIDVPVLALTAATALVIGIACGMAPAVRYTRPAAVDTLRRGVGSTPSPVRGRPARPQELLLVSQVALATILLVGAGLLVRSYLRLTHVDIGYRPSQVLTFQVALPSGKYNGPSLETFAEGLVSQVKALPGVSAAAYTPLLPMVTLLDHSALFRRTPGVSSPPSPPDDDLRGVSADYFRVMGIDVVAGRGLGPDDRAGRPRVVVINRAMARRHFPGEDPVGQTAYLARLAEPWQIVGVVQDVRQLGPAEDPKPQAFVDSRQWPGMAPGFRFLQYYAIRVDQDVDAVTPRIRQAVRTIDADAAVYNVAPMNALLSNAVSRPRLYAALAGSFSGVALLIATIGLYGTVAYSVAQRTREIGIRVALGARRGQVMTLVLSRSAAVIVIGLVVGGAGARLLTRYLEGMLFGLSTVDTTTFVGVGLLFGSIATIATWTPARRALSVDPVVALRHD